MKPTQLLALVLLAAALPLRGADAAANWKEHCAKCHGDAGKGDTKMGRKLSIADLTLPDVQAKFSDDEAFKAMKDGVKDKAGKVAMKPIEGVPDDELKALIPYVRTLVKK